jgi:hypothetical protein
MLFWENLHINLIFKSLAWVQNLLEQWNAYFVPPMVKNQYLRIMKHLVLKQLSPKIYSKMHYQPQVILNNISTLLGLHYTKRKNLINDTETYLKTILPTTRNFQHSKMNHSLLVPKSWGLFLNYTVKVTFYDWRKKSLFSSGIMSVLRHILIFNTHFKMLYDSNLQIFINIPLFNVNIILVLWVNNIFT